MGIMYNYFVLISLGIIPNCKSQEQAAIYRECNSTINEGQGMITSPNFPAFYPPNSFCTWKITVEEGRRIKLGFRHFDVEATTSCKSDSVMIYNGPSTTSPMVGKFCGPFRPGNIHSISNKLLLVLKSDGTESNAGFLAEFISYEELLASADSCGGRMTANSGRFHSLHYPKSNYPNRLTCTWHVTASRDRIIVLTFNEFRLEESKSCQYDSVVVYGYDSTTEQAKLLGKFCGNNNPQTLVSTGNELFVTFVSDSSGNDVGFEASYEALEQIEDVGFDEPEIQPICADEFVLTTSTGAVNSPRVGTAENEIHCSWLIVTNPGTTITITISRVNTENTVGCTRSHLMIFVGRSVNQPPLRRYCGDVSDREVVIGGNEAFVSFQTANPGEYFNADYRATVNMRARLRSTTTTTTTARTTTTTASTTTTSTTHVIRTYNPQINCPTVCPKKPRLVQSVCASDTVIAVKLQNTQNIYTSGTFGVVINAIKGTFSVGDEVEVFMPCKNCKQKIKKSGAYLMIGPTVVQSKIFIHPRNFVVRYKVKKHIRAINKATKKCR